jgi:hypothetical protein
MMLEFRKILSPLSFNFHNNLCSCDRGLEPSMAKPNAKYSLPRVTKSRTILPSENRRLRLFGASEAHLRHRGDPDSAGCHLQCQFRLDVCLFLMLGAVGIYHAWNTCPASLVSRIPEAERPEK